MKDELPNTPQNTEKPRQSFQASAADFFFRLAAASFILGQFAVLVYDGNLVFSIDCGVSAIVFLLAAIYFKLPKPK